MVLLPVQPEGWTLGGKHIGVRSVAEGLEAKLLF